MQVEQTTRRMPGLTGTGIWVRGLPTRYCNGAAPHLSAGVDGAADAVGAGGGGAGAACAAGAGAGVGGSAQAPSATNAATAQILTLPCAMRRSLPAASTTPRRPPV